MLLKVHQNSLIDIYNAKVLFRKEGHFCVIAIFCIKVYPRHRREQFYILWDAVYWTCQEMCSRRIPKILDRQESGGVMSKLL